MLRIRFSVNLRLTLNIREGALNIREGALSFREGALNIREGALNIREGALNIREGALSFRELITCIRHLSYRVATIHGRMSPEEIRNELIHVQTSILKDKKTDKRYCIPSKITDKIRKIYQTMGLKISAAPYPLK